MERENLNTPHNQPLQQTAVRNSASKLFKVGDIVSLKGDENGRFWVAKKDGKKCLKVAGCLGWMYFEPKNWEDVTLRVRP